MRSASQGLEALREALAAEGGAVVEVLVDRSEPADPRGTPGPPQIAAEGPRARGREREYELLLEMILEGARLHYGRGSVVAPGDPDLALLLGDQLYALGLSRLAALGDLEATAELADVISLVAQSNAAADPVLADAVWQAGAAAVGWGASAELQAAKSLARAQDPAAASALLRAAAAVRSPSGEARDASLDVDDMVPESFNSGSV